jgi:hypothetical protein
MAIQLNDRDHLIFKLIEEHQVLLEKHISWFISADDKPVLIRDRLRKLFYLDYLLCERHQDTLPWWTTPTKPLVYRLSSMSRDIIGSADSEVDLSQSEIQRHLLEIANLRMMFLVTQNENTISNLKWNTCNNDLGSIDAKASFVAGANAWRIGIINHPTEDKDSLINRIKSGFGKETIEMIFIISRDIAHQKLLQSLLSTENPNLIRRIAFATHQDMYKSGVIKTAWQNADGRQLSLWPDVVQAESEWQAQALTA